MEPLVPLPRSARVCIVMMSAIGDAVHVLPVVSALRRHDPTLHLTWVLQPAPAALVGDHPAVDEVVRFDRGLGWRAFPDVAAKLRRRRFDLVLDLQVYFKASVVTALTRAPVRLGFDRARARDLNWLVTTHRIPPHPPQHVQDQYFEFLRALGVDPEPVEWGLGPTEEEREAQRAFFAGLDRPAAALAVGSSDPRKDWLPERWAALADALWERHGLQPVLVGGPSAGEKATEAEIRRLARHPVVSTLGNSLREMVGIIDGAALTVSLDTAAQHISVAVDTPVVALSGHTNPKRVGPYRFRELVVDAYGDPGEEYAPSLEKREGRMERIGVDDVLEKVDLWARTYGGGR